MRRIGKVLLWAAGGLFGLVAIMVVLGAVIGVLDPSGTLERRQRGEATQVSRAATAATAIPTAAAQATVASATAITDAASATQRQKWSAFLDYAPHLVKLLQQSDEVDRNHAAAAAVVSVTTAAQFYTLTDRTAQAQGNLKIAALQVSTPPEGRDLQTAVYTALQLREDAFNKLKIALDTQRLSAQAEYQEAKRLADVSAFPIVTRLFDLCGTMDVGPDECNASVGLGRQAQGAQ